MANTAHTIANLPTLPATSATFLIAGWVRSQNVFQGFTILQDTGAGGLSVAVTGNSTTQMTWTASGRDNTSAAIFSLTAPVAIPTFGAWTSFAISGDTSTETVQLLVNTSLQSISPVFATNHEVAYFPSSDPWTIGPPYNPGIGVDMSDFRFGAGEGFFDLSSSTNVAKLFVVGGNHPVFWGVNGALPTGLEPAVYLTGNHTTYPNNAGSGGSFTVTGPALVDYTPGPT